MVGVVFFDAKAIDHGSVENVLVEKGFKVEDGILLKRKVLTAKHQVIDTVSADEIRSLACLDLPPPPTQKLPSNGIPLLPPLPLPCLPTSHPESSNSSVPSLRAAQGASISSKK